MRAYSKPAEQQSSHLSVDLPRQATNNKKLCSQAPFCDSQSMAVVSAVWSNLTSSHTHTHLGTHLTLNSGAYYTRQDRITWAT